MFPAPGLRTYSKRGRNGNQKKEEMNNILFAEKAFQQNWTFNMQNSKEPLDNTSDMKFREVETSQRRKKQGNGITKNVRTRTGSQPAKLKRGRMSKRSPSAVGGQARLRRSSSSLTKRNLDSLPREVVIPSKKVKEWIEQSSEYLMDTSDDYPSIEVMRGEEKISRNERKQKLLGGYENLVDIESTKESLTDVKPVEGLKQDFFAELRVVNRQPMKMKRRDDTPVISSYINESNCLYTSEEPTEPTGQTSKKTRTESSLYTATMSGPEYPGETAQSTSLGLTETTSVNQKETLETMDPRETVEITPGGDSDTSAAGLITSPKFQVPKPDSLYSSTIVGKKMKKYLGKKMKKYLSSTGKPEVLVTPQFPSDMSSITKIDSIAMKKTAEMTPQHISEVRLPESPSKRHVRCQRRRNLEPKNSTKLFTTGFVEVCDAFPHMSTIRPDSTEPMKMVLISPPQKFANSVDLDQLLGMECLMMICSTCSVRIDEINADLADIRIKQGELAKVKTSTPNKVNTDDGVGHFEFDISSVNPDSDDEILHFHKSPREVNSEEIINLSDVMVDPREDLIADKEESMIDCVKGTGHVIPIQKSCPSHFTNEKLPTENSGKIAQRKSIISGSVNYDTDDGILVLAEAFDDDRTRQNRTASVDSCSKVSTEKLDSPGARQSAGKQKKRSSSSKTKSNKENRPCPVRKQTSESVESRVKQLRKHSRSSMSDRFSEKKSICDKLTRSTNVKTDFPDGIVAVCTLMSTRFTCPIHRLRRIQCTEKNLKNQCDLVKNIQVDDLL